ncbi:XRE family transcriptional regulator [Streptomyces sp. NPDC000133]|uniref:MmyB family transcriptional regulator n=1 Tax=Streptomyces sp. NPDC000133 TaxID=3364535 RepID=UPI0036BD5418
MTVTRNSIEPLTITRILRSARARIDPARIPGFAARFGPRSKPGLTQGEVAQLLGGSDPRWYRDLELGKPRNFSPAFLRSVRRILALDDAEWEAVWRLAGGSHSVDGGGMDPLVSGDSLPDAVVAFVEGQQWPALLCDRRWDVLACNAAAAQGSPWMRRGFNLLEWTLTYPDARFQLINWEFDWAMPLAAQLRLHSEQWPEDERIQSLVGVIRSDPRGREMWDAPKLPTPSHPDASESRRLFLPHHGGREFEVTLLSLTVDDIPSSQLLVAMPARARLNGA